MLVVMAIVMLVAMVSVINVEKGHFSVVTGVAG